MIQIIASINSILNRIVWGAPMLILLVGTGILLTVRTRFFQLIHLKLWMESTLGGILHDRHILRHPDQNDHSISQFQSMCTVLAATIGTGNIVGVAAAILIGGPGAVFWMWIAAIFGMMTSYSENVLGIYFRRKNNQGEWSGGPMYYLRDGLGARRGCRRTGRFLAGLFSFFCVLASFGIGNMSQINAISGNMKAAFGTPRLPLGIVLMLLGGFVILGGLKRIASVTEKLVPLMSAAYLVITLSVCIAHINQLPAVFHAIFSGALGLKSATGGMIGSGLGMALTWGTKRGVFSNEAGLGSSVMVNASSNVDDPVQQGMWGIFEVFADTLVVCSLTAFAILSSGLIDLTCGALTDPSINSSSLTGAAFSTVFGAAGPIFVAIAILLFAFSTVLGWSQYGAKAFEYLFGRKSVAVYKCVFVLFIAIGATMDLSLAWDLSDTFNGLMALPNLIGVLTLSPIVLTTTRNYLDRTHRQKRHRR